MKKVVGLIACVLMATGAMAQVVKAVEADKSIAFRIYNGYTGTLTLTVRGGGTQIVASVDGGCVNTITGTGDADTIAKVEAALVACTNTAGLTGLKVDSDCALADDSTDAELISFTNASIAAGEWANVYWDTSAHLSYDLYFPDNVNQAGQGAYKITKISGNPVGTGNVTLSIYLDRVLIDQRVYVSPVYVNPATWGMAATDTNAFTADNNVTIDYPLGPLRCTGAQPVLIRAARATTATTGMLAATVE